MFEMNSLTVILLAEACVTLLVVIAVMIWLQIKSKSKHRKAIEQLVSQIKQQSKTRNEENGSFLQESYDLTENELASAVETIDKQERKFFKDMVDALSGSFPAKIISLDASIAELINTYKSLKLNVVEANADKSLKPNMIEGNAYKSLKPKAVKANADQALDESLDTIAVLQSEKERLTEELEITRETMSNMIKEYSSMFGGGAADEEDNAAEAEKVTISAELSEELVAVTKKAENQTDSA
jgi:hypothetical protein